LWTYQKIFIKLDIYRHRTVLTTILQYACLMDIHGHGHGNRPGNSQKADKTIQSLLAPKKDLITKEKPTEKSVKENPSKVAKRNHSDLDSSSDHSMDFTNIAQDLEDIKKSLKDNIKKEDLTQAIEGIVKQSDIENIVTNIVHKLLSELKSEMKKEINKQISENQQKQSDELQTLKNENSGLKKAIQEQGEQIRGMKNDMYEVYNKSYEAISMANYNDQYSRKFNIKLINYPIQNNENLRKNFVITVKEELKVNIEERDIIAIHRLPTRTRGPPTVIVKIVNSDIKSNIMKKRS